MEIHPLATASNARRRACRSKVLQLALDEHARVRKGAAYRDVLAALFLAGVRNVQPRPSVGHKFHAVLVVNSAHLASLSSPDAPSNTPATAVVNRVACRAVST